jgi:hypothetical protein
MLDLDMLADALGQGSGTARGVEAPREVTLMIHDRAEALMQRDGLTRKEAIQRLLEKGAEDRSCAQRLHPAAGRRSRGRSHERIATIPAPLIPQSPTNREQIDMAGFLRSGLVVVAAASLVAMAAPANGAYITSSTCTPSSPGTSVKLSASWLSTDADITTVEVWSTAPAKLLTVRLARQNKVSNSVDLLYRVAGAHAELNVRWMAGRTLATAENLRCAMA